MMNNELVKKLSFLDDNSRFKALFLLLLRSDDFKKSESLANDLGVTSRTIKNDLKILKNELYELNIKLIAKQSKGYKLEIDDKETENYLKAFFQIYQANAIDNEFDTRIQYIIRRLLVSKKPIKMESLQEELCINVNNSLSRELQQIKKILSTYQLSLVIKPHHGMYIKGDNFAKTILLIRMYKFFDKNSTPEFRIEDYNKIFDCEENEKENIRKIFIKTITKSRIVFSDVYIERFIIYLIYFRNKVLANEAIDLNIPNIDLQYSNTEEYELINELVDKLRNQYKGFDFSKEVIQFLTYIAIMSTDLYRFKDCSEENYGTLLESAEETRNYMLNKFSDYFQINMYDDYTCMKDLLKIMIPISIKIKLGISDDIDVGFHNVTDIEMKPILGFYVRKLSIEFYEEYNYYFSDREKYLIFNIFLGFMNRIILSHRKLKLAIIAINGRLSTQQLKFNLQHYFSEFIEKIETRVLYELESIDNLNYDYFLCTEYGKNMNISYEPIYFADESMTESDYVDSLNNVFFDSYGYDDILPPISLNKIEEKYRFDIFLVEDYLQFGCKYEKLYINSKSEIQVYFNFNSSKEEVKIFYFANKEDITLHCEKYFIIVNINIGESKQKLKMILNVIDKIAENPEILMKQCQNNYTSYKYFFIR